MFSQTIASPKVAIDAPIEHVWSVLIDLDKYHLWNPWVVHMQSTLVPGDPIIIHVQMNKRRKIVMEEIVTRVEPHRCLAWRTDYPRFLLRAERFQQLEVAENGQCLYFSHETFRGPMVPLVMAAYKRDIERGFAIVAYALKERAETLFKSAPESGHSA